MSDRVSRRSQFIDASRGLAMLFVFVSHFAIAYFDAWRDSRHGHIASLLALPSTPTFVLLSGLLVGFLSVQSSASFANLTVKLMDRGLFLLVPAHALIMIAHVVIFGHARFIFITDAIGVCILLGPWLITRMSPGGRFLLGVALIALSWRLYLTWSPVSASGRWVHSALLGDQPFANGWLTFPIIPWLGCYLLATPLGEALARWRRITGDGFIPRLAAVSICAIAVGVLLHGLSRHSAGGLHPLLSAGQKYPPSPSFMLTSGGLGLGVTAVMAWVEQRKLFPSLMAALARIGRCSLVVFLVQYFVYYVVVYSLRLPLSHWWPIYLAVSVAFIYGVAYGWDRYVGNEYLTVGLPYLIRAPSAEPASNLQLR